MTSAWRPQSAAPFRPDAHSAVAAKGCSISACALIVRMETDCGGSSPPRTQILRIGALSHVFVFKRP